MRRLSQVLIVLAVALSFASCVTPDIVKGEFKIDVPSEATVGEDVRCSDLSTGVKGRLWRFEDADVLETGEPNPVVCFKHEGRKVCSIRVEFLDGMISSQDFFVDVAASSPGPVEPDPYEGYEEINGQIYVSPISIVEQPLNTPARGYWPDGRLIPIKKGDKWQMFWPEYVDYLTEASTPWPEDHIKNLSSGKAVFGKGFSSLPGINENGSWFVGIFPKENGHYVGFFHGESHWSGDGVAYKTIGVAYSDDYGVSWKDAAPIIIDDEPKGATASWSGLGDACVVWDEKTERYLCYYQSVTENGATCLCVAASADPEGRSGTWKKWDGNDFTLDGYNSETGIGGANLSVDNLSAYPGANPTIIWSTYLNKWVIAWHSWTKFIFMSFSEDCIHWSRPFKIAGTASVPAWYPGFISEEGEKTCGQRVKMYFSHNQNATTGVRDIGCVEIIFK